MRRLLAILGATAMVVAAVVVRSVVLDDDGSGGGGDRPSGDDRLVVVCDPDLRAACDALGDDAEVTTRDSADVAAELVAGSLEGVDAWVTSAAWLEVVAARAEEPVGDATVLASSDVVLAVDASRAGALADTCGSEAAWRCVGDRAEQPWADLGGDPRWGPLRTGLPDADTAVGLTVAASVATGYFGNTDFAANDFSTLRGWAADLASPSDGGDRNLLTTLVRVRGTYTAGGLVAAQAGRTELEALPTEPVVAAVAVVVDLPGGDDLPELGPMRDALVAAGWEAGDGDPATLLKPGVMAALHTLWKDITS
ncbi:MAG: hypothetical protein ACSLFP_03995 [Acidimicrobiales bacterium]